MAVGQFIPALPLTETSFVTTLTVREELRSVVPGRAFKKGAKNDPLTQRMVDRTRPVHELIQRAMTGKKQTNARRELPLYITEKVLVDDADGPLGDLGPSVLYTPDKLELVDGLVDITGTMFIYEDGESRGEGELCVLENGTNGIVDKLLERRRPFLVHHGIRPERAAAFFGDYNGKGYPVTANLLIARDQTDPYAVISREVFGQLGLTLELEKRQVSTKSDAILTAHAARLMTAAMFVGVNAVSFGADRIPTTVTVDKKEVELDTNRLHDSATKWIGHLVETQGVDAFKSKDMILRAAPVLVSLGAIGRSVYFDKVPAAKAAEVLAGVDWTHASKKWDGISGKRNAAGQFSVSSGKEAAHAVYAALTDPTNVGYATIR